MLRPTAIAVLLLLTACNSDLYVRDGVTDGDTFYLSQQAMFDPDPALQSWTAYSLVKSACQLEIGGRNPARASSYDCEIKARRHLLDTWFEKQSAVPGFRDDYLETLAVVDDAGHLDEYVVYYFGNADWTTPDELDMQAFGEWQERNLRNHKASTRIVGSWNYRERVLDATRSAAR
jgi:hypothetical protein